MRKSTKLLKRFAALLFVVLISIESFAAVVTDNDGSAFITKAEFDSMKSSFQQQLDKMNSEIDNKIDNAINGYLSGIKVGKVSYLDSLLNKVNALAEDFYLDGSGNKVKYGYRTMARKYNNPTSQIPNGAKTALFISRGDINDVHQSGYARFALNEATRTGMSLLDLAKNDTSYKTGKYFMYNVDNDGNMSPANSVDEYTYYYYVTGAARTITAGNNPGLADCLSPGGMLTLADDFKNERTDWSLNYNDVKWVWNHQEGGDAYSTIKCVYGTTFQKKDGPSLVPICAVLDQEVIGLSDKQKSKMTLQENSIERKLFGTLTGFHNDNDAGTSVAYFWYPIKETGEFGTTISLYPNCHPYNTVRLSDMVDSYSTSVLDEKVLLTDGVPVCKATANGYIDIKMEFIGPAGHRIAFGIRPSRLPNEYYSMYIDSSLRDFNNVKYSTRTSPNIVDAGSVQEMRIDVKEGDVIFIKCVDATSGVGDYALCGVRTQEIKQTSTG